MIDISSDLTASVQILTLSKGLYLVAVKSATPRKIGEDAELTLPAIHVGAGPGGIPNQIEIIPGPRTDSHWLFESKDMVVVKVASGPANLLLTSLRTSTLPNLEVEVQRLGTRPAAPPPTAPALKTIASTPLPPSAAIAASPTAVLRDASGRTPLRTRIGLHIQDKGDVSYVDNYWAGALGERLAIEAFSITPLEGLEPQQIEYKGLAESGQETDWITGGGGCGSYGRESPLAGFCVRVKAGAADGYDCEYRGSFSSGKIVGPVRNGAPCRGAPGDRLEAIQIFIVTQAPSIVPDAEEPLPAPRPIGPRFSVFRENLE